MKAWFIHCRTGCTCCSNENHYRGPYASEQDARARQDWLYTNPVLGSQYARRGIYEISECGGEQLPDGRLIIERRLFTAFIGLAPDGSIKPGKGTDGDNDDTVPWDAFERG